MKKMVFTSNNTECVISLTDSTTHTYLINFRSCVMYAENPKVEMETMNNIKRIFINEVWFDTDQAEEIIQFFEDTRNV